jgi:cupin 2 domain-containing protein
MHTKANLFEGLPAGPLAEELVTALVTTPRLRIERIISTGQASAADNWYDQNWDEWVVLLRGSARLLFEGEPEPVTVNPGDSVCIPAHCRHQVLWTDPHRVTVWLAVHYE